MNTDRETVRAMERIADELRSIGWWLAMLTIVACAIAGSVMFR